ncbi:MAG: Uma2 family endonuclease [Acidobacteriota bacterium]
MSQPLIIYAPNVDHLITEDDEPVDNILSEKQQRLLTEPLYSSWQGPGDERTFVAMANVGIFYIAKNPPIVPDMFLSLDVELPDDLWAKEHRCYFVWEYGKPPDVVVEVVSNTIGEELGEKLKKYATMRVVYYIVFDPEKQLGKDVLKIYKLHGFKYRRQLSRKLDDVGLGLALWEGEYEGWKATWLRWTDMQGNLIATGRESIQQARAEKEKERAEKEAALERAEKLAAKLRELGHEPDKIR